MPLFIKRKKGKGSKKTNVGVNALAKELGISASTVCVQMKKGKSAEQIRSEHAVKRALKQREALGKAASEGRLPFNLRPELLNKPIMKPPVAMTGYTPSRAVPKPNSNVATPATTPKLSAPSPDPEFVVYGTPDGDDDFTVEDAIAAHKEAESLNAARLRRAIALADEKELQNAQKMGELIPVAQVKMWGTKCITAFRDKLLQSAGEMADELAAETRPAQVREVLEKRYRQLLQEVYAMEELWGQQTRKEEAA